MDNAEKPKSLKGLFIWGVCVFTIPPMAGLLVTVISMAMAFHTLGNESGPEKSKHLAAAIGTAMHATVLGMLFSFVGAVLLIICLVKYLYRQKKPSASP